MHTRPYRETSLLVDVFSSLYGRETVVAKGAKRGKNPRSNLLQPMRPLLLAWQGKGEMGNLTMVDINGPVPALVGKQLFSAFYINELITRLLHKHEACPELYVIYENVLDELQQSQHIEPTLRLFERRFLEYLGYGLNLDYCADDGKQITSEQRYWYYPDIGIMLQLSLDKPGVSGAALIALANETIAQETHLKEIKQLMRSVMKPLLGDRPLNSRKLFRG